MTELLAVALVFLASSLIYASEWRRGQPRMPWFLTLARVALARAVATLCAGACFALWTELEPGPAAFLVTLTGLIVSGTAITLLAPVAPRAVVLATTLSALGIPLLIISGALP